MILLQKDLTSINQFGYYWKGQIDAVDGARQSSALEALNAAMTIRPK